MPRDPLARMDVDTMWPHHEKVVRLQWLDPQNWPTYWAAYMALLGKAWRKRSRMVTLEQAWLPALPCSVLEARERLVTAGLLDRHGRVPKQSWTDWVEPALARIDKASEAGRTAAAARWHTDRNASALRPHSDGNAQPTKPSNIANHPSTRGRARPRGATGLTPIGDAISDFRRLVAPPPDHPTRSSTDP